VFALVTDEINGNQAFEDMGYPNLSNVILAATCAYGITTIVHNVEIYEKYAVIAIYTAGVRLWI
jgi:hypothetical protein